MTPLTRGTSLAGLVHHIYESNTVGSHGQISKDKDTLGGSGEIHVQAVSVPARGPLGVLLLQQQRATHTRCPSGSLSGAQRPMLSLALAK